MEQWEIDAVQALLETSVNEVEPGQRVYVSSATYGSSRYHHIDKRHDGVQIEQTNVDDKWGSRVNLRSDEIPALLKTLLTWHLAELKAQQESQDENDHPF